MTNQVKTTPLPSPTEAFTIASGPMTPKVKAKRGSDGVEISVNGVATTIPCSMAVRFAHTILTEALGDLHS